jgi:hypothetical protein
VAVVPLESDFVKKDNQSRFRKTKWIAVVVFVGSLGALALLRVQTGSDTLDTVSNIVIPSVYVTSLYIAWKKLLSSNAETLVTDEAENRYNITNLGRTTLSLREVSYIELRRVKGGYTIAQRFEKVNKILDPGESYNLTLTVSTETAYLTDISYFNYNGDQVFLDREELYYGVISVPYSSTT